MIHIIKSYDECRDFIPGFREDHNFSDPMLTNEEQVQCNLIQAIGRPDRCVLRVDRDGRMIGLFAFLILREEQYLEMLVGLSREREAYREVFRYLERHYPGYQGDFICNPANDLLKELLESKHAEFEPEQQKMVLGTPVLGLDTTGVEPYTEQYAGQFLPCTARTGTGQAKRWQPRRIASESFLQSRKARSSAIWM